MRQKRLVGSQREVERAYTPVDQSVEEWPQRVEKYVVRDPQTGRVIGSRIDPEERDPRLTDAMEAAKLLCGPEPDASVYVDGSSPKCRAFWRIWAGGTLRDAGVTLPTPEDVRTRAVAMLEDAAHRARTSLSDARVTLPACEEPAPEEVQAWAAVALAKFAVEVGARGEQCPPPSAEWFAAGLEAECMMLDAAKADGAHDETLHISRIAMLLSDLLGAASAERLLPLAQHGRRALQTTRDAAKAKADKARRESRANAWHEEVEGRRVGSSAEAAYARIERRDGLQSGTVKKAILRRRNWERVGLLQPATPTVRPHQRAKRR